MGYTVLSFENIITGTECSTGLFLLFIVFLPENLYSIFCSRKILKSGFNWNVSIPSQLLQSSGVSKTGKRNKRLVQQAFCLIFQLIFHLLLGLAFSIPKTLSASSWQQFNFTYLLWAPKTFTALYSFLFQALYFPTKYYTTTKKSYFGIADNA